METRFLKDKLEHFLNKLEMKIVNNNYIFHSSNVLHKKMVIPFMPPNLHFKTLFSHKEILMAEEKGIGSFRTSGIEIYTMSFVIG
jgi:hypothetical protein